MKILSNNAIQTYSLFPLSLKALLLKNVNEYPSGPIAHATRMKESYDNADLLVKHIQYSWHTCGDLKVITFSLVYK
jgi:hypothetical protein